MKAIETTATIDAQGQLALDQPLELAHNRRVRVIVLVADEDDALDPDDTPTDTVLEGLRQGLQEALGGQVLPLDQLWDGIDAE